MVIKIACRAHGISSAWRLTTPIGAKHRAGIVAAHPAQLRFTSGMAFEHRRRPAARRATPAQRLSIASVFLRVRNQAMVCDILENYRVRWPTIRRHLKRCYRLLRRPLSVHLCRARQYCSVENDAQLYGCTFFTERLRVTHSNDNERLIF